MWSAGGTTPGAGRAQSCPPRRGVRSAFLRPPPATATPFTGVSPAGDTWPRTAGARCSADDEGACHAVVQIAVVRVRARGEVDSEVHLVVGGHVLFALLDAEDVQVVEG